MVHLQAEKRSQTTNNGKRVVDKLYLICNPSDEAEYVDPCMYGEALTGGYVNKSFIDIEKIVDANCPKGKAAFTIAGYYTMGTTGVRVNEYDQTKAIMDDYEQLKNKPRLNGKEISGDMYETDPTIPEWAKAQNKPSYTPEEVNAVNNDNAITIEEIEAIFNGL